MSARTHVVKVAFFILCVSLFVLQSGCGSAGGKAEAPASTSSSSALHLDLSAASGVTTVVADGRSTVPIRIQVTNGSGAGMSGVSVTFATTAGALSASPVVRSASRTLLSDEQTATPRADSSGSMTVTTDANGIAQVLLTASTRVETAVVTADVQGFRTNIIIAFVPGPSTRVQLTASSTTVNAGGTSTLTATVTDANGNAVPGETVTFALLTDTSGACLTTASGTCPSPTVSGVTNTTGQATVKYTAGIAAGADTVQAKGTSPGVAGSVSITVIASQDPTIPNQIALLVSSPQLGTGSTSSVTLTALVRNALNNVVSGVVVQFVADSGSIQITSGTTGPTGTATALLTNGGDPRNRAVTVTARIAKLSSTNTVQVTGTTLTVSGASTLVLGVTTRLSILLRDSAGVGIPAQPITVSSALGNTLSKSTVTTDTTGQATVEVTARVPGDDTITVSALGTTGTAGLSISAANFIITAPAPGTQVPLNTPQTIAMHWDQSGVSQANKNIAFFATRGNFTTTLACPTTVVATISATTDDKGNATVNICSDNAGPAVISAVADVVSGPSNQVEIEFIATTVFSLVLQATPTALGVNPPGTSTQQSVITAVARDARGNLVKSKTVSFSLQDVSGGRIFPASAVTDSFGRASTVYTAGAAPSARDGVVIIAAIGTVTARVTMTVAQRPLFVTLGTGSTVDTPTSTQYALPYSVLVTDADGNPIAGALVDLTVLPHRYQKGFYVPVATSDGCVWEKSLTIKAVTDPTSEDFDQACNNEDSNFNGLLDPREDFNLNDRLDPGNVAAVPTRVTTDASGFALLNVTYPRDVTWVEVDLEARTLVAGSAGSARARFFLPGLASDFGTCKVPPPGQTSPYGIATTCSCDERTAPTCPIIVRHGSVTITALSSTTLPPGGRTFSFIVGGGTQTSYLLTATAGTLSATTVTFGTSATLTTTSAEDGATIIITARDALTSEQVILSLTQQSR